MAKRFVCCVALAGAALSLLGAKENYFSNGGFEKGTNLPTEGSRRTMHDCGLTGWTYYPNQGGMISANDSVFSMTAPEGIRFWACQNSSKGQCSFSVPADGKYQLSLKLASITQWGTSHQVTITIDDSETPLVVARAQPNAGWGDLVVDDIELASGSHKIMFQGANTDGASTGATYIDDIRLVKAPAYAVADIETQTWPGVGVCEPHPTVIRISDGSVLEEAKDYTLSWSDNGRVGTAVVTVTGTGDYEGEEVTKNFKILSPYGDGPVLFAAADADDSADETCLTWETAGTVSNAISKAVAGDTVVLARGVYNLSAVEGTCYQYTIANVGKDPSKSALLVKDITLRSADDDPHGTVFVGPGVSGSCDCRAFMISAGHLRGVTVTGFVNTKASGGGAFLLSGSIRNCIFSNNLTRTDLSSGASGGALYIQCNGTVSDCFFENNSAYSGGAIYTTQSPTLSNCHFRANICYREGGTVSGVANCAATAYNCSFASSTNLSYLGGVSCRWPYFYDCAFSNNVGVTESSVAYSGQFTRCTFAGNSGTEGVMRTCTCNECYFTNNLHVVSYGGTYRNCLFVGNYTSGNNQVIGGGTFVNCTIAACSGRKTADSRYAILSGATAVNCIVLTGPEHPGPAFGAKSNASDPSCVTTNCLYTNGQAVGPGCVPVSDIPGCDERKIFSCKGDNPYSLRRNSPAVGMGIEEDWMVSATDLIGNPRVGVCGVDAGCYTYMPRIGFLLMVR